MRQSGLQHISRSSELRKFDQDSTQHSQAFHVHSDKQLPLSCCSGPQCDGKTLASLASSGKHSCFEYEEVESLGNVCRAPSAMFLGECNATYQCHVP